MSAASPSKRAAPAAALDKAAAAPAAALDKAAAKKARKLERRHLRAELGLQLEEQQRDKKLSEEERASRRAAKRARHALARAETCHVTSCSRAPAAGFHSHMTPAVASSHPFDVTDDRDHAETPFEA
jgi:hypothetical protein